MAGDAGTINTGGGGGAGSGFSGASVGGAGGSGCVILVIPLASYSGVYTGASVIVDTVGATKVLTFKASGSYTA